MKIKKMVGAAALLSTIWVNQAFAAIFDIPTPNTPSTPPIPEFDGSSAIAVIALLAGVTAILVRAKSRG